MSRSLRSGSRKTSDPLALYLLPQSDGVDDNEATAQEQEDVEDAEYSEEYPLGSGSPLPAKRSADASDQHWPPIIRSRGTITPTLQIIQRLLTTSEYDPGVHLSVPQGTMANRCFIISLPKNKEITYRNITDDGLGQWRASKGAVNVFIRKEMGNGDVVPTVITQDEYSNGTDTYFFQRRPYVSLSCLEYHRIIVTSADNRCPFAFLQYYFQNVPEHEFQVTKLSQGRGGGRWASYVPGKKFKTNGNSSQIVITPPTLSPLVSDRTQPVRPVFIDEGHASSHADNSVAEVDFQPLLPALGKSVSLPAGLEEVLGRCIQEANAVDRFVLEVVVAPTTKVFLSNQRQLNDIHRFCTNHHNYSILCADVIPNIADSGFFLLFTVHEHLLLRGKDGRHPYMLGPMYLCQNADLPIAYGFTSSLVKHNFFLQDLVAFGPSTEKDINRAFEIVFPKSKQYVPQSELEALVEKQLAELEISGDDAKTILQGTSSLFSNTELDNELESLVYRLMDDWQSLHHNGTDFGQYFLNTVVTQIRQNLELKKRSNGASPDAYAQQICGATKAHIKKGLTIKCSLSELVRKLKEIVWKQEKDVEAAITGKSELKLIPEYVSLFCSETDLYSAKVPVSQRRAILNRIHSQDLL